MLLDLWFWWRGELEESDLSKCATRVKLDWAAAIAMFVACVLVAAILSSQFHDPDAYQFVDRAVVGDLHVDPNHLLMGPIALGAAELLGAVCETCEVMTAFKWVSALFGALGCAVFVLLLNVSGVRNRRIVLLVSMGMIFSYNFTFALLAEEFFIVQLPFLLTALVTMVLAGKGWSHRESLVLGMICGASLALSALVQVNNAVTCVALGLWALYMAFRQSKMRSFLIGMAVSGVTVSIGGFWLGYVVAGPQADFLVWVLSYAGEPNALVNELYGVRWTVSSIVESMSRSGLAVAQTIIFGGDVPLILKSELFGYPLEFELTRHKFVLGVAGLVISIVGWLTVVFYVLKGVVSTRIVGICTVWILAFVAFGVYWNSNHAQYWFQLAPVFWLLVALILTSTFSRSADRSARAVHVSRAYLSWAGFTIVMAVLNVALSFGPKAFADVDRIKAEYLAIVSDGTLVVTPGWEQGWVGEANSGAGFKVINLMEEAVNESQWHGLTSLAVTVEAELDSGGRVFVNRLFDRDAYPLPWHDLYNAGWGRKRIADSLAGYCAIEAGVVGGITVRELERCGDR